MDSRAPHSELEERRIQAKILLKSLRSEAPFMVLEAAGRFRQIPPWNRSTPEEIAKRRELVKLKHALAVIAVEVGYPSWGDLKKAEEARAMRAASAPKATSPGYGDKLYPRASGSLNRWYVTYEEALASLKELGGYLLPYRHHFFICEAGHIESLGLSPEDPDWARIGYDWVRPKDAAAFERLRVKLG